MKHLQTIMRNHFYMLGTVWKRSKLCFFVFLSQILVTYGRDLLLVVAPKYIFDSMQSAEALSDLFYPVFFYVGMYFLFHFLLHALTWARSVLEEKLRVDLNVRLGEKFMRLDYLFLEQNQSIEMFQRARLAIGGGLSDIQTMCLEGEQGITGYFDQMGNIIKDFGVILSVLWILTDTKWYVLITVFACVFVNLAANIAKTRAGVRVRKEAGPYLTKSRYCNDLLRRFEYGKEFRVFDMSDFIIRKFDACTDEYLKIRERSRAGTCFSQVVAGMAGAVLKAALLLELVGNLRAGSITVGDFSMIFSAVLLFAQSMENLLSSVIFMNILSEYMLDYQRCMNLKEAQEEGGKRELSRGRHVIEFRDVWFRYPNASEDAIRGLNVRLGGCLKWSVVGFNGAGKTTFIKLLLGLYQPQRGEILIDGVPLAQYSRESLQSYLSAVFQDYQIFAMGIDENIALSRETDSQKVWEAMRKSGIDEKVCTLEKREKSMIGGFFDAGDLQLSGGQSQKIAMSRAFYRNTDVLVMDEPTSALDVLSEDKMYRSVAENLKKEQLIFISHRLASTKFCDRILVFEKGRVAEEGTHEELLQKKGIYAAMWSVQAEKYKKEAAQNAQ